MSLDCGSLALIAAAAAVVGVFVGTTSIGGVLLIPALVGWGGLGVHQAAATVLLSMLFTGSLGAWLYSRRGTLQWRLIWPLCAGALGCGYLGALLAAQIGEQALGIVIGALIVASSLLILRPPPVLLRPRVRSPAAESALLIGIGAVSGFGSGLSGAGGPIFCVPLMILAGFAPLASIAAAQVFLIVAALSGSVANLQASAVDFAALALIAFFQLAGVSLGVRLAHALPVLALRRAAAWLCVAAGALMIVRPLW